MNDSNVSDANAVGPSSRGFSYLYMMAAFVIVVAGMRAAESIINPLLLAIFLAVLSAPAYYALLKRDVPNWLALLTVVGVLTGIVLAVLWIVLGSVVSFSNRQEHYTELLKERTAAITKPIDRWLMQDEENLPGDGLPQQETRIDSGDPTASSPTGDEAKAVPSATSTRQGDVSEAAPSQPESASSVVDSLLVEDAVVADENEESEAEGDVTQPASAEGERPASDVSDSDPDLISPTFGFPRPSRPPPKDKKGWEQLLSNQFNPGMLISLTLAVMTELGRILSNAFLILLTVIFILLEVNTFRRKIGDAFTKDEEMAVRAAQVVTSIQHYIVIKTWVSLGTGIFITIWLKFLGVPYAGLWGLLSFMFNFIPNIGSIIAAVPAVLIAWLELSTLPAFAAAFGFVLVNGVLGNFIEPRWMGKGLGLSPLVVFGSLVFWGWVLGPVGMLLSVPLTKTVRIALDGFDDTRFVAILLSD